MKYYEVRFHVQPNMECACDVLSALLADLGFESFVYTEDGMNAYVQQGKYGEGQVQQVLDTFPFPDVTISAQCVEAEYGNWNERWEEESFQPIIIDDLIAVHGTHHTDIPQVKYDILINPRLAFGSGSHQTTRMLLKQLASMELKDLSVVDAGTGTGILAILCLKCEARNAFAYDIDEWSVQNAKEHMQLNGVQERVVVKEGDASVLKGMKNVDLLIANINRNIILSDIETFVSVLSMKGKLLLSGFYVSDVPMIVAKAHEMGLHLSSQQEDGEWAMILLESDAA